MTESNASARPTLSAENEANSAPPGIGPASLTCPTRSSCTRRHHRQLRRLPRAQQARLTIDAGELRCIIGPNGAGKTTMMDVITGKTRPDSARPSSARPST